MFLSECYSNITPVNHFVIKQMGIIEILMVDDDDDDDDTYFIEYIFPSLN
jgi:hypothetical protein